MYGATTTAGASLAVTGTAIGSWWLAGVGLLLAGVALVLLFRKPGKVKP